MTKQELIGKLSEDLNVSKQAAKDQFEIFLNRIKEAITETGELKIPDFGIFKLKTTMPRKGRNILTGETKDIPSTKTIKFKLSKSLKDNLNTK